jgi:peptidoglycan/LPS O-acetylase OafA/YrhL
VTIVVIYHLWPNVMHGGFVGVDVFFVISGFLITSHLLRSMEGPGRFSFAGFYARRARRLLPASLLVLAVTAVATFAVAPRTLWYTSFKQIFASALYVENWELSREAVDYLAAHADASPVQHFWSLSTEEQFYLVWPLLLLFGVLLSRRRRWSVALVMTAVVVLSFAYSVWDTTRSPAAAYFVTPTRAWEFGIGGLCAVVPAWRPPRAVRAIVGWLGGLAILYSADRLSNSTPFPGHAALVPVLGAAALIWAGEVGLWWSTAPLANLRFVQFLGDISYSLYLWHWPLIVLVPLALHPGSASGNPELATIGIVSVLLAWLSKRYVEDPVRRSRRPYVVQARPALLLSLAGMVVVLLVTAGPFAVAQHKADAAKAALATYNKHPPACSGGPALTTCSYDGTHGSVVPDPIIASTDVLSEQCQQRDDRSVPIRCDYGSKAGGAPKVAVLGDSHTTQWLPALESLADQRGWHLTMYLKSGCPLTEVRSSNPTCTAWNSRVLHDVVGQGFSAAFVSGATGQLYVPGRSLAKATTGFTDAWRALTRDGIRVIALADTPSPRFSDVSDPAGCVAAHAACPISRRRALPEDPIVDAATRSHVGVDLVNLDDYFCVHGTCPTVIGGVLVYRDDSHMTAVFARSLTAPLSDRIGPGL